jgi:hypothetical protein
VSEMEFLSSEVWVMMDDCDTWIWDNSL